MRTHSSVVPAVCILWLVLGNSSCSAKTSPEDADANATDCRTRSPEPSGPVVDVTSIFNYSGGHWVAATETNRFAFVYGGPGAGGLWLTMLDAGGVKILESLLVPAGSSSLVRPLAIASDGTRFGLLTEDWDGQAGPLVRFRVLGSNGESVETPVDIGPSAQNGSLGGVLWAENSWVVIWSRGDVREREFWFAKLAPEGELIGPQLLLRENDATVLRLARTPSGVMAIAWQTPEALRWAGLQPDGVLGPSAAFPGASLVGSLGMGASDHGFILGWTSYQGMSGEIVWVREDGTVRCGPSDVALNLGGFAASGATMIGLGARIIDSHSSTLEAFNVLDECVLGQSTIVAEHVAEQGGVGEFSVAVTGQAVLAAWVEFVTQYGNVRARPIRPSCAD